MAKDCGHKVPCGCKDTPLTTPAPCGDGIDCPDSTPCAETFDAACIYYTGEDILCGETTLVTTNTTVADAIEAIVTAFCDQTEIDADILCGDAVVVAAGRQVENAIADVVQYFCTEINNIREFASVQYGVVNTPDPAEPLCTDSQHTITYLDDTAQTRLFGGSTAYGRRISQLEFQKGDKGKTIKLTIDTEIQKLANELLAEKAGSICVMDIFTGHVIAMHSSPSFDPNKFVFGINTDDWQLIRNDPMKPLVNKSLSGNYSPGSTIKPIVALSALENKIVSANFRVNCKGHKEPLELYGQTYHCWKKEGHGIVDMREAMKQSCDTYFYEVARRLGVDKLSETAKKFGLGKKVFEDLFEIEKSGLVPSTSWKKNVLGINWVLGETIITGIGQGYIQTTPIQLCLMTAQIANGGHKIIPKLIVDSKTNDEDKFSPIVEDAKNMKLVQDAMFSSTNEVRGTSYKSRIDDPKYQFAGKTGTAQVKRITKQDRELDLDTSEIPYEERDHALYIAFGPYKNPRYAVSIVIEHGGSGGAIAAPLAKQLFKKIIDRHEIRKNFESNKYINI